MLNLNNKSHWGNSQYINYWWSNSYKLWEELDDLEDRCFSKWLYSVLQTHGILDSNSNWHMSRDGEIEETLKHYPPLQDDDIWGKLAMQEDNMVYATYFSCSATNPNLISGHCIKYYKSKNLEVIDFFFDQYPNSGLGLYFVREV